MATGDGDGDPTGDGDGDGDPTGDGDGDPTGDGDGDTPCAGPEDCSSPDAPFCDADSGVCVSCEETAAPDASCAGLDAATPVCAMGSCVECAEDKEDACEGATPVCDTEALTCAPCTSHDDCPGTACNLDQGNCFDPANVRHVAGDDLDCDDDGEGSAEAPYCSLGAALLNAPAEPLLILHELFDDNPYLGDTQLTGTVALFAAEGDLPRLQSANNKPAMTVGAAGVLFLRGVRISGGTVEGFRVSGGKAWLDEARVVNNSGGGIVVAGGGECRVTNSFVGGDVNDVMAINVEGGSLELLYSTVLAGFGESSALTCDDGSTSAVRNSLLLSRSANDELQCPSVDITTSALELAVGDNVSLGDFDANWLVPGFAQGNFSLSGNQPMATATAAQWTTGDPLTDIDGEPRPDVDGTADYAGADRP